MHRLILNERPFTWEDGFAKIPGATIFIRMD
jgi:hypothetical protein